MILSLFNLVYELQLNPSVSAVLKVMVTGSSSTLTEGQNHMLTCRATGGGSTAYTYMWLKNGIVMSGKTSSKYSFSSLSLIDSGRYSCRVRVSSTIMKTSRELTITVMRELDMNESWYYLVKAWYLNTPFQPLTLSSYTDLHCHCTYSTL